MATQGVILLLLSSRFIQDNLLYTQMVPRLTYQIIEWLTVCFSISDNVHYYSPFKMLNIVINLTPLSLAPNQKNPFIPFIIQVVNTEI